MNSEDEEYTFVCDICLNRHHESEYMSCNYCGEHPICEECNNIRDILVERNDGYTYCKKCIEEHNCGEEEEKCEELCDLCKEHNVIKGYCENGQCNKSVCEECDGYNNQSGEFYCCEECDTTEVVCKYCNDIIDEEEEEPPTTCIGCEGHYHNQCGKKGSIRYMIHFGEDYCYDCKGEKEDLENQTVKKLKIICKENGIKRYSKLRKQELIDLIEDSM